jgi:uncharacterized protein YaiL (DUF2058 family)
MSDSLRDQLLKAGFAAPAKPEPRPQSPRPPQGRPAGQHQPPRGQRPPQQQRPQQHRPQSQKPQPQKPAARGEIDLAKAYALRQKTEREEKEREQREAEQRGKERKERRQKLTALLGGKALNDAAAEIPRHFPHANKIRRIYVTAEQLPRLNGGELAVVQVAGRYLLVTRETGLAAQAIDPEALVRVCDPHAAPEDDVPADLVW